MDPHCFDVDPDPDPAQNLDADPDPDPGGGEGVGQPKMCILPGKILGTPLPPPLHPLFSPLQFGPLSSPPPTPHLPPLPIQNLLEINSNR